MDKVDKATISFPIFGEGFAFNIKNFITVLGFPIYLYGIIFAASFALAAVYIYRRHKSFGLTKDTVLDMVIMSVIGGIVGARLYYIAFRYDLYFTPGNFRNILLIREGGLAVYGGIIGVIVFFLV